MIVSSMRFFILLPLSILLAVAACGKRAPLDVPPPPSERLESSR